MHPIIKVSPRVQVSKLYELLFMRSYTFSDTRKYYLGLNNAEPGRLMSDPVQTSMQL